MSGGHFEFVRIDHVQLAMPLGAEADAVRFYEGVLGFERVPKPQALAARGGCWFRMGSVQIHLGVESDFRAAKKAHPAFIVRGYHALLERLAAAGVMVRPNAEIPDVRRCHIDDPFGNRLELIDG